MRLNTSMGSVEASTVVVHLMIDTGKSACGYPAGHPSLWPAGHLWVRIEKSSIVSCPRCQRLLPEVRGDGVGKLVDSIVTTSRQQNGNG